MLTSSSGFNGKFDRNNEEGWTLLPNGNVLTIDTYTGVAYNKTGKHLEIYNPSSGKWMSAGSTGVQLWDSKGACGGPTKATYEIGPAVLRPDGTVFATGSNTCPSTAGHTSIYDTKTGLWTPGFDVPGVNDAADAPAPYCQTATCWWTRIRAGGKIPARFTNMHSTGRDGFPYRNPSD